MKQKIKTKQFNVLLEPTEKAMLDELTKQTGRNGSQILREALRTCYQMVIQNIPTCASGDQCKVPGVWSPGLAIAMGTKSTATPTEGIHN